LFCCDGGKTFSKAFMQSHYEMWTIQEACRFSKQNKTIALQKVDKAKVLNCNCLWFSQVEKCCMYFFFFNLWLDSADLHGNFHIQHIHIRQVEKCCMYVVIGIRRSPRKRSHSTCKFLSDWIPCGSHDWIMWKEGTIWNTLLEFHYKVTVTGAIIILYASINDQHHQLIFNSK